ncbi:MAG: FkbM family methyltransferase [Opitutaceae bacterium]|nr:FkbM family methyltransferase [Opitutaceae bacterium]
MRAALFYDPVALWQRVGVALHRRRRRRVLRGTPAAALSLGHLDSLELLQLLADRPPAVIHDIGANAGTWTCLAKSLYPSAQVAAFEPLPQFFSDFAHWTSAWPGDVTLHRVALGERSGRAEMHVTDQADASSLLPLAASGRDEFKVNPASTVTVEVARLDDLLAASRVKPPDLLKLDVQGFELAVLRGGEQALAAARAVICEVSTRRFYERQPLLGEVLSFLEARNFHLHAFGANMEPGAPFAQADALFLRA